MCRALQLRCVVLSCTLYIKLRREWQTGDCTDSAAQTPCGWFSSPAPATELMRSSHVMRPLLLMPSVRPAGVSAMADGRIIVTGGNTDSRTSWFTPASMTWSEGPQMNLGRGYQVLTDIIGSHRQNPI